MQLARKYIELIAADVELQGKIAKATGKNPQSVRLWVRDKISHDRLLMKPVLIAISQYTGVPEEMLIKN